MKVLIIGIRASHASILRNLYPNVDFTFKTDGDRVRGRVSGSFDKVYVLYKFTNHSVERAYGGESNYVRVSSYTHLSTLLAETSLI